MLFKDILGHDDTKRALVRSVQSNHVAHAQLFDGPPGGAGIALAWAFATYVNCEDRQPDDACGCCASCIKMRKLVHPDVYHIFPLPRTPKEGEDLLGELTPQWRAFLESHPYRTLSEWLGFINATGNQQGIIPIRESRGIINKLSLKAFEGEFKIMLFWQPELLNVQAANALLKILEEPPEKTLFLIVSSQSDKLLTTIISRTQRVAIRAFTDEEVTAFLLQKGIEERRARQIAYLSEGNLSTAMRLTLDTEDDRHTWFANWMRKCYSRDFATLVKLADEFDGLGKEKQKGIFDYTLNLFRDLFLWQNGVEDLLRLQDEELSFVQKFGKAVHPKAIELLIQEITEGYYHLERNARAKVLFLDISLTAARTMRQA
ncbi:DNA polymerase III subunit [Runella zeae]|uniref:DNA polymerase III subunit n=1 Tax=Runella zeae TaxID=94255 RepID=UPI00041FE07B|nr:DNA polymerase III subunit delta [Runella zeae]